MTIITSNFIEQVQYSEKFWMQYSTDLLSRQYTSNQTRNIRKEILEKLESLFNGSSSKDLVKEIAEELRGQYQEKLSSGERYWEELNLLYWLAAIASYFFSSNSIKFRIIPSLTFSYHDLGYKRLTLLNSEDIDLLIKTYGKPRNHKTLREIHSNKEESGIEVERKPVVSGKIQKTDAFVTGLLGLSSKKSIIILFVTLILICCLYFGLKYQ